MPGSVLLVVLALAASRLTGLLVADEITRPGREAILRRLDDRRPSHRALAYLISCAWCAGLHIGAVVAVVGWLWGDKPAVYVPATALAFGQVAGMLSTVGRGE